MGEMNKKTKEPSKVKKTLLIIGGVEVLNLCNGGCPKHRFVSGQNYLCSAYKKFLNHIAPYAQAAKEILEQGRAITELMNANVTD